MLRQSDLRPLSYAEFGVILETLTEKVRAFCADGAHVIDLVAPILRSGGVTGAHLASRLGVVRTVPVQYKYDTHGVPTRIFEPPHLDDTSVPVQGILLADTNTVRGGIAQLAANDLHARFPQASIYLASAVVDVALPPIAGIRHVIFGRQSNESRSLDMADASARGISREVYVFPWEDADEQWREILAAERNDELR